MVGILAAITILPAAGPLSVDWKFYALAGSGGVKEYRFYEAARLTKSGSRVQVWSQSITTDELRRLKPTDDEIRRAGDMVLAGYVPPIAAKDDLKGMTLINVVMYELIANRTETNPKRRALWEIDCATRTWRTLSVIELDGRSVDGPSEWTHYPPGSAGETLAYLVCR